jgi:hypothetical protein
MAAKKLLKASRPPAEATIPTTGKLSFELGKGGREATFEPSAFSVKLTEIRPAFFASFALGRFAMALIVSLRDGNTAHRILPKVLRLHHDSHG